MNTECPVGIKSCPLKKYLESRNPGKEDPKEILRVTINENDRESAKIFILCKSGGCDNQIPIINTVVYNPFS